MWPRHRMAALTGMCAVCVLGCGDSEARPTVTRRDSADVPIVANAAPRWSDGEGWTVASTPTLVLSDALEVTDAARLTDGMLVVLDALAHQLRFYDASGTLQHVVGREGNGPGEFAHPTAVARYRSDSVVVFDPSLGHVVVFSGRGTYARTVPIRLPESNMTFVGALADGAFVVQGSGFTPVGRTWREPAVLVRVPAAGGRLDTLVELPGPEFYGVPYEGRPIYGPRPFGRQALAATTGRTLVVHDGEDCRLRAYDRTGRITQIVETDCAASRVTAAAIQAFERRRLAGMREGTVARQLTQLVYAAHVIPYPKEAPPFARLLVDSEGTLWAGETVLPQDTLRAWSVLQADGRWLGTVTTPAAWIVSQIDDDVLLAITHDSLDRTQLELHKLDRRARGPAAQLAHEGPRPSH